MNNCIQTGQYPGFSLAQIKAAVAAQRLLTMELEPALRCNFSCRYCYAGDGSASNAELSLEEMENVIDQAVDLGVQKIIILGGEPMMVTEIFTVLDYIRKQGVDVELFTNGSLITAKWAGELFRLGVQIALKMNSRKPEIQDFLAGRKGAFDAIQQAFGYLLDAGYPSSDGLLSVSTVICRQNYAELTGMWRWLRDHNITPYFEMLTPQGNALVHKELAPEVAEIGKLFQRLSQIDRREYNRRWEPQPPMAGNRCLRHQYSCLVTAGGKVMPCVGVTIPIGDIHESKLADILSSSVVLRDLKNYRQVIKGPCKTCEKGEFCYGCRGAAYQVTGDYLASDPLCWNIPGTAA